MPERNGQDTTPLGQRLRTLRESTGMSLENFAFEVRRHLKDDGGTFSHLGKIERGAIYPNPEMLAAYARAADSDPRAIPEYRLALARREIDERVMGLEPALENLSVLEAALAALPEPAEALLGLQRYLDDDRQDVEPAKPRRSRTRGAAATAREPGAEPNGGRSA